MVGNLKSSTICKAEASFGKLIADGSVKQIADGSMKQIADGSVKLIADGSIKQIADGSIKLIADGSMKQIYTTCCDFLATLVAQHLNPCRTHQLQ